MSSGPASSDTRKIALVLPNLAGGGAERLNLFLAEEFIVRGYKVEFALMDVTGDLLQYLPDGATIADLGAKRMRNVPAAFAAYLKRSQPAAIVANMWPLTVMCVAGRRLAHGRGRLVVVDHNTLSLQYGAAGRLHNGLLRGTLATAYRAADGRIGVSSGVANDLARLSGIPKHHFTVVNNPVPAPSTSASAESLVKVDALWGSGSGHRILAAGSMKPQKNHALLIRAFAKLLKTRDARLMILGEGPLRAELEALVKSEGLIGKVVMPGFVSDPTAYYRSANLFVLSSDYEGFGNVIVEALACGIPVVSTDCPSGPAEILDGGRYGRLVPVGDADALADAMSIALQTPFDPELLKRRAANFTPEKAADQYLKLLFPDANTASAKSKTV